jgi:putative ABC transport system permease protein
MIIASLVSRPVRSLVSVLAVALEVTMILVIVGLTTGISNESGKRIVGVGADVTLQPPNSSMLLALSSASMSVKIGDKVAKDIPNVKAVAPVLIQTNSQGGLELVYGIDPVSFEAVGGPFVWRKGSIFKNPNDIIVDDIYASAKGVDVGDQIELLNQKFNVSGIVEHGKGARLYLSLAAAQEMTGAADRASIFFIKANNEQNVEPLLKDLGATFNGYQITRMRDLMSLMSSDKIPGLDAFIRTVVFIAVCVGVMVIFLSMYTTITERTREIGILRSLGASKSFVVRLFMQESLVICMLGVGLGLLSSKLIAGAVQGVFPTLIVLITGDWILKASVFALLSGVIGSFYPSLKAAAQDPIEALAYE